MTVRTWIRNLFTPRTSPNAARKAQSFRPTLLALEPRDCPATALIRSSWSAVSP